MNIHERISEKTSLAKIYAEDGAFRTAACVLRNLADELDAHIKACDEALEKMERKNVKAR